MKEPGKIKSALYRVLGVNSYVDGKVNAAIAVVNDTFGVSLSGQKVTLDKAMQVSAVWACVRLLAETVSTLPLKIYEKKADGSRAEAKETPLYKVLCVEPNRTQTPVKLIEFLLASYCIKGNAYFEKKMIGDRLIALIPILPQNVMDITQLANGKFEYKIKKDNKEFKLPEDRVWHVRGFGLDGALGLDVFSVGRNVIGAAMASNEASASFFKSGMSSSGILSVDSVLTPDQRKTLRENMTAYAGSSNSGKMMVLESGMKYQGISLNPEQSQLLETRGYDVEEICRIFKVPPTLIGFMSKQSSWASSLEGLNQQFLTYTLLPILKNIEQSITKSLVPLSEKETLFAKFNYEGFLRANSEARANYYHSALNDGWMNRNDVRAKEDLPPMEGGDVYTVQSALIPIEQVGTNYDKTNSTTE
ncbi:MAG: phage portal protein [Neisseriaceae bacterium]|nr:phage portal protein [Neisseriaceae bacterium]